MSTEADGHRELRDHLRVLRRRKWSIALFTLLVVAAAVGATTLQTKVYRASADVLLRPRGTESILDPSIALALNSLEAPTEMRVIQSQPVRHIVEQRIGAAPAVSVTNPADTLFLSVSAESTDPNRAAVVANAYAKAYVDFRRIQAVDDIKAAVAQLQAKVQDLDSQITAITPASTTPATTPFGSPTPASTAPATTAPVDASTQSLAENRDLFVSRIDQLTLAATQQTGGAQQVSTAQVPTVPVRPTPLRNALIALFVGLALGVGLAFLRDHLDDSLRTKDDVEQMVPGVPVLGLIPALRGWKDKRTALVVSVTDPKSPAAEAYRSLRTSVQFLGIERSLRTLHVTSPSAAEGKSTTIANLAVAMAGAGRRVVLVDADLRRPRLHAFFGLEQRVGFTSVLIGEAGLADAVQDVPGVPGLSLLASGPVPPNPSELLAGVRCGEQLSELAATYDLVLIDCPPVLPVTDAAVLASRVDGTLLVVSPSQTDRRKLRRAVETLEQVNASLLGVVLNSVTDAESYGYSYRYAAPYVEAKPRRVDHGNDRRPVPAGVTDRGSDRGSLGASPARVAAGAALGPEVSAALELRSTESPEAPAKQRRRFRFFGSRG